MEKYPKIAITILNWNGRKDTDECLKSLEATDYPDYGIILVDNGSKPGEAEALKKEYGDRTLFVANKENLGFAEGNNVAIRRALMDPKVQYVFLLNNDTTVEPDFLARAVERAEQSGANMVAIRMMRYSARNDIDSLGIRLTRSGLALNIKDPDSPLFCPCGGAVLYSRKLLETVGEDGNYFDPEYFCYAEDLDLGFRARLSGFECALADKSVVYHKGSVSSTKMSAKISGFAAYQSYRNIAWTLAKNLPSGLLLRYLPFLVAGQLSVIALYFLRRKPKMIMRSFWHGIRRIPEMRKKGGKLRENRKIDNKTLAKFIDKRFF